MNIIALAFDMANAVGLFVQKAKKYFYHVMLFGHRCPKCNSSLHMRAEGMCRCNLCKFEFDPTIEFQNCSTCGGVPVLQVRRYVCKQCCSDITSKFLFDGLVFDRSYFKQRMADSRQRRKERREHVRKMLAECRSDALPLKEVDLESVPGLLDALNSLTTGIDTGFIHELHAKFDLKRYQEHIQDHIQNIPVSLNEIPPLSKECPRKDRIWRFVALIFLAHTGVADIWQDGWDIMVVKNEINGKGQGVFRELEESDGIEGPVGRVEA